MRARALLVLVLALPPSAVAHPLGNFTINRLAALGVTPTRIVVRYVVDMAEIPAFREIAAADADGSGSLEPPERDAYLARMGAELARGLVLRADGRPLALALEATTLELPSGAGGLPTLRLEARIAAALAGADGGAVEFRDDNFAGRPGWQEVVADCAEGCALVDSSVPRADGSAALRAYPEDQLAEPPAVRAARFRVVPAAPAVRPSDAVAPARGSRVGDRLTGLIAGDAPLGVGAVLLALAVAALLGALHALGPGHGKAVVGAYLVGAHGTARHALVLGLVVTATHTLGVYALGLATLAASRWIVPERLFPWLGVCSGLLVLGIGSSLALSRLAAAHGVAHHHHDHGHGLGHAPATPSWRSVVGIGVSGGLLPCPSALVVMLGAVALGRIAFGLGLIVAFSVGLAAVLTTIGLLFVHARRWLERVPLERGFARWAPVASATVIAAVGVVMVARGLMQTGVIGGAS